ncbi:uncharacterized protein LOC133890425 [Phragmites australis]|uniref:uncharacterized protein LOC133890425 n=1 Tax=Phragmites australis TaxID=29695 RepID=UPI002D787687|nr:uncharacterized protein LOC133890425 [Phragmites australis]
MAGGGRTPLPPIEELLLTGRPRFLVYKRRPLAWPPTSPSLHLKASSSSPAVGAERDEGLPRLCSREELAKLEESQRGATAGETEEQRNKFLVLRLYEALNARDHAAVQALLAPDLEWWFHGPPKHQHMMRILTGGVANNSSSFRFVPRSVDAFGSTVIAEGSPAESGVYYWVHAWTVGPDGVITQLREYFNTDLTVTRLAAAKCVWKSRRPDSATNSLPGLLLAI